MTRFNTIRKETSKTTNYEGGRAYTPVSPEMELYQLAATTILNDTYYESWEDRQSRMWKLVDQCDPQFVANLAVYLRSELNLRSIPLVLVYELSKRGKLKRETVEAVIQRADEITELLALHQKEKGSLHPIPYAIHKGIEDALPKFNAYQYRKYNRGNKGEVSFQDTIRLLRPKPSNEEESKLYRMIAKGELPPIETWETGDGSKESWEKLIRENKVPYMALLRNLRNLYQKSVDSETISRALAKIMDGDEVKGSLQFPFRWFSAFLALKEAGLEYGGVSLRAAYKALDSAVVTSLDNLLGSKLLSSGSTLIACDTSGSMRSKIVSKDRKGGSVITPMDIGLVLGHICAEYNPQAVIGTYATDWNVLQPQSVLEGAYKSRGNGGATHGYKVLKWAIEKCNAKFDKLFFFSDGQIYADIPDGDTYLGVEKNNIYWGGRDHEFDSWWKFYKDQNPKAHMYLVDLMGYCTVPVNPRRDDITVVSGWSEAIFKAIVDTEDGDIIKRLKG
jgi:60 kDa SS-A/Ro ribonucleoprotein